jgi:hypothetical protein
VQHTYERTIVINDKGKGTKKKQRMVRIAVVVPATVVILSNESLPKAKVSAVPGDRGVAGVFQDYDLGDDLGDFHIAQLGDFPVRIAAGVSVANGDLLESAGDGTARPHTDGRVFATVMAAVAVHTYPDGSFLVPCLLHR